LIYRDELKLPLRDLGRGEMLLVKTQEACPTAKAGLDSETIAMVLKKMQDADGEH